MAEEVRTLVFTDLVNSTAVKAQLPGADITERNRAYLTSILDPHRQRMEAPLASHGGRVVKTEGDAYFLDFANPIAAVHWAIAVQSSHLGDPIATPLGPVQVKIGLHTGAPLRDPADPNDYIGNEVDYAARIAALASGGQIVLSEVTAALVRDGGLERVVLHAHGVRELKGIGQVPVYELLHPAHPAPQHLKEPALTRHNLPTPTTPYIGRETELATWVDMLLYPTARVVTLVGFGGLGKTRSALQLATLCAAEHADIFPDGVWWVELAEARTGEAMLQRMAHDLNFYLQSPPSAREQIFNFLQDRQALLILDNTEQIPDAGAMVRDLLAAAPKLKCLVTSRRPLQLQGEQQIEVRPLPLGEAEQLFVARAAARKPDFAITPDNAQEVKELCRRLDGVPLAIELAASRIALSAPREMLQRLDQRFRLLQSRAPDLPPRQRALRAAIDWSYDLLGDEDKLLLAQLAVFARGFTLEDIESVCDVFDVYEGVQELQSHSFISGDTDASTQQTRFGLLEAVRDYAAEKLAEQPDGGHDYYRRHAEHFLELAQARTNRLRTAVEQSALFELQAAFDNVIAALEWAKRAGELELGTNLALQAGIFLVRRGFQKEAVRRIEMGLELVDAAAVSTPLRAELLRERAGLHLDGLEPAPAEQDARAALALYEATRDVRGQAHCHNLLGLAARETKEFAAARDELNEALRDFEAVHDTAGIATAHANLGLVYLEDGDTAAASQHFEAAMPLRRRAGDKRGIAEVSTNLGLLATASGDLECARQHYSEALVLEQALGYVFGVARSLFNLGEVAELQGRHSDATRLYLAAHSLFGKIGSPYAAYAADALGNLAGNSCSEDVAPQRVSLQEKSLDELVAWALTEVE